MRPQIDGRGRIALGIFSSRLLGFVRHGRLLLRNPRLVCVIEQSAVVPADVFAPYQRRRFFVRDAQAIRHNAELMPVLSVLEDKFCAPSCAATRAANSDCVSVSQRGRYRNGFNGRGREGLPR